MFKAVKLPHNFLKRTSEHKYGLDTFTKTNNSIMIPRGHECLVKNKSGGTPLQSAVANYNKKFKTVIRATTLKQDHPQFAKVQMVLVRHA